MFFKSFLIKYGEIGIKGKNRYLFKEWLFSFFVGKQKNDSLL